VTHDLLRDDAYLKECRTAVTAVTEQGVVLGRTAFYPLGLA